ncbi:MAG: thiamine phosphate synthase [Nitrospirota bacterium]|nr:thiamine phosphate synthase [Nitrospirota bacterium]
MRETSLHGLYLILDERWSEKVCLRDMLLAAATCGVRLFQYRNKEESMKAAYTHGLPLRKAAKEAQVQFIVNDRCDLALALEADGVHLGQDDLPLDLARSLMGAKPIIGISTHGPEQVEAATRGGANYLGFGPIFPTATKIDHEPVVGIDGLKQARARTNLPIFAIGGITIEAIPSLVAAGADGVAVASAILNATDVKRTLHDFLTRLT